MPMNAYHQWLCRSEGWARKVRGQLLPWALSEVELGTEVLEIGPGFGATTRVLADRVPRLTAVEIDQALAERLRGRLGGKVSIVDGDGTAMPLPDNSYSGAVCFTMLHHVPSPQLQDRLFADAFRVLRPGGVFAGSDGLDCLRMRLIHLGDTFVPLDPRTLPDRLFAAGFSQVKTTVHQGKRVRFQARKAT